MTAGSWSWWPQESAVSLLKLGQSVKEFYWWRLSCASCPQKTSTKLKTLLSGASKWCRTVRQSQTLLCCSEFIQIYETGSLFHVTVFITSIALASVEASIGSSRSTSQTPVMTSPAPEGVAPPFLRAPGSEPLCPIPPRQLDSGRWLSVINPSLIGRGSSVLLVVAAGYFLCSIN